MAVIRNINNYVSNDRSGFIVKNRRGDVIAVVAIASFLAWTRNLMIMVCRMCFGLSLTLYRQ